MAARKPELDLIYRDGRVVAVDKPPGLAVIPGRGESATLIEHLGRQLGVPFEGTADPRVRVVHRLDKDTSGVILYALDVEAQRHLSHQFQNNTIRKEYLALVSGRVGEDTGSIDAPLGPHPTDKLRMAVTKHGRPARTDWEVEGRFREYTLLRCFPRTGKTHQIRVHLKHIGHPLAIDPLYNSRGEREGIYLSSFKRRYHAPGDREERPLIGRLTLHARRLTFGHPAGEEMTVEAPVPKDFRAVLNMLGKYSGA